MYLSLCIYVQNAFIYMYVYLYILVYVCYIFGREIDEIFLKFKTNNEIDIMLYYNK